MELSVTTRPEPKLLMLLRLLKPLVPVPTPVPITEMSVEQEERLTPSVVTVRQCGVWVGSWDLSLVLCVV